MTKSEIAARKRTLTIQLRKIRAEMDLLTKAGDEIRRSEKRKKLSAAGTKQIQRSSLRKGMVIMIKGLPRKIVTIQNTLVHGQSIELDDGSWQNDRFPWDKVLKVIG